MSEVHLGGLAPVLILLAEADLEEQDLTSGRPGGAPLHVHRAGGDGLEVDVGQGLRHRLQILVLMSSNMWLWKPASEHSQHEKGVGLEALDAHKHQHVIPKPFNEYSLRRAGQC